MLKHNVPYEVRVLMPVNVYFTYTIQEKMQVIQVGLMYFFLKSQESHTQSTLPLIS